MMFNVENTRRRIQINAIVTWRNFSKEQKKQICEGIVKIK